MFEIFTNPGYLAAAGALVSAPIIIHLINRMRFKRIRWAAMEFLLKAQKRNRRRLIIEQLILLALRCLLVALVGLLVMRFVGFSMGGMGNRKELHVVLLDDTLSMNDEWKDGNTRRDGFSVAKYDVLYEKIGKGLAQAGSSDRLLLLLLSHVGAGKDPILLRKEDPLLGEKGAALDLAQGAKVYEKLNTPKNLEDLKKDLDQLEPSLVHVPIMKGVKRLQEVIGNNPEDRITVHILTDFRQKEWALPDAEELHKTLIEMAGNRADLKVRLIDTIYPYRTAGQGAAPLAHDNVGITDLRAGTRVVGRDMPVTFTVTLVNHSAKEQEVNVVIYLDDNGSEQPQVDFNPTMPIKIPSGKEAKATFEMRFNPALKPGEPYFAQISARLESAQRTKLEGDHLPQDNVRHAAVEVRDKVPLLVIDGKGPAGRQENMDSFFLRMAMISVPGASYDIEYGDELGAGFPTRALERTDLLKYPSIFLLNVRELSDKQLANLENYVKEGGGVGIFMGPLVNPDFYNKKFYNAGKGLFPVPLKEAFFPKDEPLKPQYTGEDQVLLRQEMFGGLEAVPIFGEVFKDEKQKLMNVLKDLPIRHYFQVPRAQWRSEPGRVFELATLPNEVPAPTFTRAALDIVRSKDLEELLEENDLKIYRKGLERHRRDIESIVSPTSEKKASHLAGALEAMLKDQGTKDDRGGGMPNLTEFWSYSDPRVATLRDAAKRLADQAKYGDPFVVAAKFGKGKVVAVMTSAGKEWNDWGGGSSASFVYQPFIWEIQNYLSSQGSESNLTVGTPVQIVVDTEALRQKGQGRLKLSRVFHKPRQGKPAEEIPEGDDFGQETKGVQTFQLERNRVPGMYVSKLGFADATERPLATYAHVFNVDTVREGNLTRVGSEDIQKEVVQNEKNRPGSIQFEGAGVQGDALVPRRTDLSESPWLFLLFIAVLVAEQALAVHLSFHLKSSEGEALTRVTATVGSQKAA